MRRKPYTEIGVRRVLCFRCGEMHSSAQWQICSLNNEYKCLCTKCDIELNRVVLKFMGLLKKEIHVLIEEYEGR